MKIALEQGGVFEVYRKLKTTISLSVPILKGGPQRDNPEDTYT